MQLTEQELHELRVECFLDPTLFARTFLKHWFQAPMSWAHRGMLALLLRRADFLTAFGGEDWPLSSWEWTQEELSKILQFFRDQDGNPLFLQDGPRLHLVASRKTMLMLPRGVGKTTVVNLANLIAILYKEVNFLVYVSETATHAETQLRNIRRELEGNALIRAVFGQLQPDRSTGLKWTDDYIEATNGVVVAARGRGSQVRGLNVMARRPDRIVVDDLEDKESVSTEEQRRKTKVWFHSDLEPALPQMAGSGEIIALGTLLHPEALLMSLSKNPEWVSVIFGALAPNGEAIAPFYMSPEQFEAKRLSAARNGMLLEFYMEYGSKVWQDDGSRKFVPEKIKIQVMQRTDFMGVAQSMDPAISEDRRADFSSIAIVGMTEKGNLHVLDIWAARGAHPREQVDKYFELHFLWLPTHHGVETVAYQAALVHLLQEEMFRFGKIHGSRAYFEITRQTHGKTRKDERIEGILAPRYAAGYITHQRSFPEYITMLADWPLGKKDIPDAVAMAVALLDPFAANAAFDDRLGPDGDPLGNPLLKDQYAPIERELGNWRHAP